MFRFGSLQTRIIVLTTVPLIALWAFLLTVTHRAADQTIQGQVRQSLREAGSVFEKLLTTRQRELMSMARVTARDPRFFATLTIPEEERGPEFGPTVEGVSLDFLRITDADFLEVYDRRGKRIVSVSAVGEPLTAGHSVIATARHGTPTTDVFGQDGRWVVAAVVPVEVAGRLEAVLRLGAWLDQSFADEVRRLTGADVTFVDANEAIVTTLRQRAANVVCWRDRAQAVPFSPGPLARSEPFTTDCASIQYLMLGFHLSGAAPGAALEVFVSRELAAELAPLRSMERNIALVGLTAVLIMFCGAYVVARSVTRPLSSIVTAASRVEKGDYQFPLDTTGVDEVATLARSFDEMRGSLKSHVEHLRDINEMKSDFIALAGHELKTPLTVVTSFNDLIASGTLGDLPSDVQETTEIIGQQLSRLNQMVERILTITSFEQGIEILVTEETDLAALVQDTVAHHQGRWRERRLALDLELEPGPAVLICDPMRMRQAVEALLDNAVRFTPDGGRITVTLDREAGKFCLQVIDTGIGIPSSQQRWIFEKGYEAGDVLHHSSGDLEFGTRGLGTGLALCKAIVKAHGGTIGVESRLGEGSCFTISLPARAGSEARVQAPLEEPRVLVTS